MGKRFILALIGVAVALFVASCADDSKIAPEGVSLDRMSITMQVGEKDSLIANITPSDAHNQRVHWTSSEPNVVSVTRKGAIEALAVGKATITVTTVIGKYTATCDVVVNPVAVTGISLDKTSLDVCVGETTTLTATITPANATDQTITWASSNDEVATVAGGVVTGVDEGEATITATTNDGSKVATCKVKVTLKIPTEPETIDVWRSDAKGKLAVYGGSASQTSGFLTYNGDGVIRWDENTTGKPRTATMEFSTGSKVTITQVAAVDFKGEWTFTTKVFGSQTPFIASADPYTFKSLTFGDPRNSESLKAADGNTYANNIGIKGLYYDTILDACVDINYENKTARFGVFLDTRDGAGQQVNGKYATYFPGLATRTATAWAKPWIYTETELGDPDYEWLWFTVSDDLNTLMYLNRNNNGVEFQTLTQYSDKSMNQICGFGVVLSGTNVFNHSTVTAYSNFYQVNTAGKAGEFFERSK